VPEPERYPVPCRPPRWARGGHAQTIWSHLLGTRARPLLRATTAHRELALPDGDRLLVLELPGRSGVRVVLGHGLTGDVNSDYLRRTARALEAAGHSVWAFDHRGCGEGQGLAARPYHSGRTEDLEAVLAASRADAPDLVQVVVGFSLSGNLALLHAGLPGATLPDGIVAVNPPVDLEHASVRLHEGPCRLYELRFMRRLQAAVRARERAGLLAGRRALRLRMSLCEFDDAVTAPDCGFADGRDYYTRCSSGPGLATLEVPTVILTAADDPFVDAGVLERLPLPPNVLLHVEPTGGHVAYIESGGRRWLDGALLHYVEQLARLAREPR
jgi:predicted alpha/beta-fold hydrolase